jgi:hypothetical protein
VPGSYVRLANDGHEWGELPSAGDTSYAGVVPLGDGRILATWYSSPVVEDPSWLSGLPKPPPPPID